MLQLILLLLAFISVNSWHRGGKRIFGKIGMPCGFRGGKVLTKVGHGLMVKEVKVCYKDDIVVGIKLTYTGDKSHVHGIVRKRHRVISCKKIRINVANRIRVKSIQVIKTSNKQHIKEIIIETRKLRRGGRKTRNQHSRGGRKVSGYYRRGNAHKHPWQARWQASMRRRRRRINGYRPVGSGLMFGVRIKGKASSIKDLCFLMLKPIKTAVMRINYRKIKNKSSLGITTKTYQDFYAQNKEDSEVTAGTADVSEDLVKKARWKIKNSEHKHRIMKMVVKSRDRVIIADKANDARPIWKFGGWHTSAMQSNNNLKHKYKIPIIVSAHSNSHCTFYSFEGVTKNQEFPATITYTFRGGKLKFPTKALYKGSQNTDVFAHCYEHTRRGNYLRLRLQKAIYRHNWHTNWWLKKNSAFVSNAVSSAKSSVVSSAKKSAKKGAVSSAKGNSPKASDSSSDSSSSDSDSN